MTEKQPKKQLRKMLDDFTPGPVPHFSGKSSGSLLTRPGGRTILSPSNSIRTTRSSCSWWAWASMRLAHDVGFKQNEEAFQ